MPSHQKLSIKQGNIARYFVELRNASEAYRRAYDAENCSEKTVWRKAIEVVQNGKVAAEVDRLKAEIAKRSEITIDEVSSALRAALDQAMTSGQTSAAVQAAMGLGKLGGLITEKQRIETVNEAEAHLQALREMAEKRDKIDQAEKIQRRQVEAERDAADREVEAQADTTFAKHLQNTDAKSL